MSVTPQMIKELREKTGAGMMDCKKALDENGGDFEKATDWLRTKGLASAAKKSSRTTAEGLVSLKVEGKTGIMLELNAETDFVAKNDQFIQLVNDVTSELASKKMTDVQAFKESKMADGATVEEKIKAAVAVIGENINLRRVALAEVSNGTVISYVHNAASEGMGKIGVLVALETSSNDEKVAQAGKQIAMHIAASKPESLNVSELDPALVEREKNIFAEQARASGKPDSIIEKMIEGRVRKYYEEVVLLEQVFVMDGKTKISQVLEDLSKEVGSKVEIKSFVRFALGEGIEKEQTDFAAEVAAAAGTK
ncbi:MAG: elongation factor Ts [Alphaproteobacteria bacterium]|nr:elongation factor Ts [Alphaproteobacteria bacterium]OJV15719.1 MAG: translation elongation factor Ts [Alphaproteobacteria bacterium 33-17]